MQCQICNAAKCQDLISYSLFTGPTNSFKSTMIRMLLQGTNYKTLARLGKNTRLPSLQPCLDADYILWEEPVITRLNVQEVKLILEGASLDIPVKGGGEETLDRRPCFITTNHSLGKFCSTDDSSALDTRVFIFEMKTKIIGAASLDQSTGFRAAPRWLQANMFIHYLNSFFSCNLTLASILNEHKGKFPQDLLAYLDYDIRV